MCGAMIGSMFWGMIQDLPSYDDLQNYNPPTISRVYTSEGKLMDEYAGGVTVSYMTNDKLLNIGLKKLKLLEEDLEKVAAEDIHELLRAWEIKHRHLTSESVVQHTLFRKETRWPGYYYRGDHMKLDDENWHVLTVSRRDPETGEYTMEKAPLYHLEDKDA